MTKQPDDYAQRQQALNPTQSFICEAPAGSGKTELLTQRFLTLLARVERPEQVLAITFTRKAVGEMRERILSALQSGLNEKPQEPHKITTWELATQVIASDNGFGWQLLNNPNRLQIKTFDSLCAGLANTLPLESALGAKPQVSDDPDELYRRAIRALLNSLEDDVPWADALTVLLTQLDNRFSRLEDLLVQMLARREEWLPLLGYSASHEKVRQTLEANLASIIRDTVNRASRLIPYHLHQELVELAGYAAANLNRLQRKSPIRYCLDLDLDNSDLPGDQPQDVQRWQGIVAMLLTNNGQWRASVNKRTGFPAGENHQEKIICGERKQQLLKVIDQLKAIDGLLQTLTDLRLLPAPEFNEPQWTLLDALSDLLPVLSAQLMVAFQETNSVDFAEISIRARQALGSLDNPSQLALKMDYQLQHILVDEFQDTSASQVQLLDQLTSGWEPGDGRTVFCVGDAMQSIYGFRGANVGLFLNCREQGLANVPLTPLKLTTNFRSQAGVVEWVNAVFQQAFPRQNDISTGAVTYSSSTPFHEKAAGRPVWVHGFVDRKDTYDEARTVLGVVRKTRSDNPAATIAILVRNRNHVAHILPLLKEAGIRYRAVDLEPLQDHAVIQDLMALTQALLHPGDRTAWLSVLRAPWCGLSLVDLEAIANLKFSDKKQFPTLLDQVEHAVTLSTVNHISNTHEPSQPSQSDFFLTQPVTHQDYAGHRLSADGLARIQRVLPVLKQAHDNRDRKPFRSWIEGTWLALGGAACVENPAALKNAEKYLQLLESWPYASALPSIEILKKSVEKLYAAPDPEADESLQIMTIHKSKGLEFDVVIVPALHRYPRREDPSLLMWQERLNQAGRLELVMAPMTAVGETKHPTYAHLQAEAAKKSQYEACRLLYVACTRARQQLHLSAHVKQDKANTVRLKHPPRSSLLNTIWQPLQTRIRRYDPKETLPEDITTTPVKPRPLHRLSKHWQFPPLPTGHQLEDYIPRYQYDDDSNELVTEWQDPSSRYVGTVIHRYLQAFGESGIDNWSVEKVKRLQPQIKAALQSLGTPINQLGTGVDTVVMALSLVLQDKQAEYFLSSKHPFHACEYPITLASRVGPKHLQIDRVFTTRHGITWVVDYKTATPEADQTLDDFLTKQAESYEAQLKLYSFALQQAGFKKIKMALYFPLITTWFELEKAHSP